MKHLRLAIAGLALLALGACGNILPQPAPPPSLYRLTAAHDFPPPSARPIAAQLLIDAPAAEAALDTTRIALTRSATTLDYFADAAWTDRLSTMLQALLVQSLDNAHRFAAVGLQGGALRADVVLVTELRHFEASYASDGPPRWRVELTAKLVKLPERTIIADHAFSGDEAAARNDVPAIVDAADVAWRRVAGEIADWSATALAPRAR